MTPRANFAGGSATPRSGHSYASGGSRAGQSREGGMFPPPSPAGAAGSRRSKGGDMWGQSAESWSSSRGRRTPGQSGETVDDVRHGLIISYSGYNSTPSYDERSTPRYGSSGGRTPGGRTPGAGGRTPQDRRSGDKRTPRGHFGDATPLYDE